MASSSQVRMTSTKLDWSDENCLQLIDEYRARRCLWDPRDKQYRLNLSKSTAWREIAAVFQVETAEVKKKMNSLLASFRRERTKDGRLTIEMGNKKIYKSRWFAYKRLSFLLERFKKLDADSEFRDKRIKKHHVEPPIDTFSPHDNLLVQPEDDLLEPTPTDCVQVKDELFDPYDIDESIPDHVQSSDNLDILSISSLQRDLTSPEKQIKNKSYARKRKHGDEEFDDDFSPIDDDEVLKSRNKSATDAFCEYIAFKLKDYDEFVRNTAQHKISEVLFQADIGMFDRWGRKQSAERDGVEESPAMPTTSYRYGEKTGTSNDGE